MTDSNEVSDWLHSSLEGPANGRREDPAPPGSDTADPVSGYLNRPQPPAPAPAPAAPDRTFEPVALPAPPRPAPAQQSVWDEEPDTAMADDDLDPERIPTLNGGQPGQNAVRIGLWGATGSGKTTYLASLPIAAAQNRGRLGRWVVAGLDNDASEFLVQRVRELSRLRTFPEASVARQSLRWSFHGEVSRRVAGVRRSRTAEFVLELQDAPGHDYAQGTVSPQVVDHLARSQGLIYLFDPIMDNQSANIEFFHQTLEMLMARMRNGGRLVRGRLPQYLSVCVTKFDHPAFFQRSVQAGYVTQSNEGALLPGVPSDQTKAYFDWVLDRLRASGAPLIGDLIRASFHSDRVRYFATSAIGFRLNRAQVFDYRDYRNVEAGQEGQRSTIRDMVRPINVLEPLIALERAIHG